VGTVVSGTEGYYLSGASYDSKSFSPVVSTRDAVFKTDGTKMFTVSSNDDLMHEHDLSTAWDVSTAVRNASNDLDVSTQGATSLHSLGFKPDGTKCYACDRGTNTVYQYSLSTAWDLSTASYDSSVSVNSYGRFPEGFALKADGTSFYVYGDSVGAVYQYDMTTAYDISTASYANKSFTLTTAYVDIDFNPDGSKMYALLSGGVDTVNEYNLSTAWDISTATDASISFYLGGTEQAPEGFVFDNNGTKMYVVGDAGIGQYSTALSTAQLDLSTGSVFDYTPTSDVQVTLTNPAASGTSSGATLLLGSEDSTGVGSTFSTTLYDGNSGTQTITNGIDLAADGGMVWGKIRSSADNHWIVDSENGIGSNGTYNYLQTNLTTGLSNFGDRSVKTFNSDGFTLANSTNDQFNLSPETYVSWTFKKQAKFFDIVTYTGNGSSNRQISHNLGGEVGMLVVKRTDGANPWAVYHRGADATAPEDKELQLNATDAAVNGYTTWARTAPTTTNFTVGSEGKVNENGWSYVAYLFAHDTDASGLIKCGSYTHSSSSGNNINLGWEPQWLLVKSATSVINWYVWDTVRGWDATTQSHLKPNTNAAESTGSNTAAGWPQPTSTGFRVGTNNYMGDNQTYIYMAIRNPLIPTITYDPNLQWSGGTAPTLPATGEKDVITFNTTDGGTTYKSALAIDGAK
jgi:6-phosphogluconolactonase (cycloisomerase 2 family)